ncbi:MAG: hypothetical protein COT73_05655 [Bdellovibrio sp. CG10_big_fil_rev_8_21_14_0_10_47_8]|nr:MAG: hypothetical protein COT73_05655 [Bdellovibrio sp. CG10_big_fil_rev_8_21_14_0_10_47_8]
MINRLIKNFIFNESIRSHLVISDPSKIRLNSENPVSPTIELSSEGGQFSTDTDLFIETPLTMPNGVQKWLKFEAIKPNDEAPPNTFIRFKVKTTGGNYFWNGSDWAIAGASDWMTESELNANFDSFPIALVGNRSIGFVVNLQTSDPLVTPKLSALKFLGEFDVDFLEDIVYDGIVRKLNTEFRSTSQIVFPTSSPLTSVDLNAIFENKGYNITGIRKVINLTDDPLKLQNLFDSYAQGPLRQDGFTFDPGVVTLNSSVGSGKVLEITFEYVPEVVVNTHQDFFEIPTLPSLVIEAIDEIELFGFTAQETNAQGRDLIRDIPNLTGVLQLGPEQKTLRVDYAVFTNLQLDQLRLSQDLAEFLSRDLRVKSFALDRDYDLRVVKKLDTSRTKTKREAEGNKDSSDTNVATGTFDILGVLFFNKPSKDVPLVGEVIRDVSG